MSTILVSIETQVWQHVRTGERFIVVVGPAEYEPALDGDPSAGEWHEGPVHEAIGPLDLEQLAELLQIEDWESDPELVDSLNEGAPDYALVELVTLAVDEENVSEDWWDAARESLKAGVAEARFAERLLDVSGRQVIVLPRDLAERVLGWAMGLPGWEDEGAPDYAPHPLVWREED